MGGETESKRVPADQRGCHCGGGPCCWRKRASEMNVLSMEAHLSRYLALNSGRISTTANRKTRKKSSRIWFRRESFKGGFNSVACRFDAACSFFAGRFARPLRPKSV